MANCCNPITIPVDPCPAITTADLGVLTYLYGLDANNCRKYEAIGDVICDMLAGLAVGAPFRIGDRIVGPDCQTHQFNANIIYDLFQGCTTASATITYNDLIGQFCADVNPQWVRDLFSASGDIYVSLVYNNLTGAFVATTNIAQIFADGLCPALAGRPAGPASGPGSTITYLDPDTCQRRQLTTPATFNLCASLAALPAGTPIGQGDFFVAVDPSTCERRLVTIPDVCAVLAAQPVGAPYGPGSVFTISDPSDCQRHVVTIPPVATPFNLCATLAALPAGAPVGGGGSITVVDPDSCQRRLVTIPAAFDLCTTIAGLPVGAPVGAGQTITVIDPTTCQQRLVSIPSPSAPFDLCVGIAALPAGAIVLPGSVITIIDAVTCQRRVFPVPLVDVCAVIAGRPIGAPVGAGGSITVLDANTCERRVVTLPAAPVPFDLCGGLNAIASTGALVPATDQFVIVDGAGNCSRKFITAAAPCSIPSRVLGLTVFGATVSYEWSALEQRNIDVFAAQPPVAATYPGAAGTVGGILQSLSAGINNTHLCRAMSYQTNLRSGRTQIGFPFGQIYQAIGKNIALTGPFVGTGNVYLSSDNRAAGGVLLNYTLPADVWTIAGNLPPAGAAAWTMDLAPENAGALNNAPAANGQFFTAHMTVLAVQN